SSVPVPPNVLLAKFVPNTIGDGQQRGCSKRKFLYAQVIELPVVRPDVEIVRGPPILTTLAMDYPPRSPADVSAHPTSPLHHCRDGSIIGYDGCTAPVATLSND